MTFQKDSHCRPSRTALFPTLPGWRPSATVITFLVTLTLLGCGGNYDGRVRLLNAAAGSSELDARVNDTTVAHNIPFGRASTYVTTGAGSQRTLRISKTGEASQPIVRAQTNILDRTDFTYLVTGTAAVPQVTTITDDPRPPAGTMLKLRVVNASPTSVNVYLLSGTTTDPGPASLAFADLQPAGASPYLPLPPGSYQVVFTGTQSTSVLASSTPLALAAGSIDTEVLLPSAAVGEALGLLFIADASIVD